VLNTPAIERIFSGRGGGEEFAAFAGPAPWKGRDPPPNSFAAGIREFWELWTITGPVATPNRQHKFGVGGAGPRHAEL